MKGTPNSAALPAPASPSPEAIAAVIAAEAQAVQVHAATVRAAAANPLPGPLARAFDPEPLTAAGFTARPVVAADFALLRRLDSPLFRRTLELAEYQRQIALGKLSADAPAPETTFSEEELAEMVYQFTRPVREGRAQLAAGRDAFREAAMQAVSDRVSPLELPKLVAMVVDNFTAAFGTALGHTAPQSEGGETVNFSPAPAQPTGSAGGSIMSPGCAGNMVGAPTT